MKIILFNYVDTKIIHKGNFSNIFPTQKKISSHFPHHLVSMVQNYEENRKK